MTIYCGVDFHARQQTVAYCDTANGEVHLRESAHEGDDVRGFCSMFTGEVVIGVEASGYSTWFVEMVESLGRRVLIGDAAEVRRLAKRMQKNDRRDAGLLLDREEGGGQKKGLLLVKLQTSYLYHLIVPGQYCRSILYY